MWRFYTEDSSGIKMSAILKFQLYLFSMAQKFLVCVSLLQVPNSLSFSLAPHTYGHHIWCSYGQKIFEKLQQKTIEILLNRISGSCSFLIFQRSCAGVGDESGVHSVRVHAAHLGQVHARGRLKTVTIYIWKLHLLKSLLFFFSYFFRWEEDKFKLFEYKRLQL